MSRSFSRSGRPHRPRKPKSVPPQRPSFRPCLEVLEDRINPTNTIWAAVGGTPTAPVSWDSPATWVPLTPPPPGQLVPNNTDKVFIGNPTNGTAGYVVIPSGSTESVAEVDVTSLGGSSLTVNGELDIAPNGNTRGFTGAINSDAGSSLTDNGTLNVGGGAGLLAGTTTIAGAFNLQSGVVVRQPAGGLRQPAPAQQPLDHRLRQRRRHPHRGMTRGQGGSHAIRSAGEGSLAGRSQTSQTSGAENRLTPGLL